MSCVDTSMQQTGRPLLLFVSRRGSWGSLRLEGALETVAPLALTEG